MADDTYYRLHYGSGGLEFSAENAWSGLWGAEYVADGSKSVCPECDATGVSYGETCSSCDGEGYDECQQGYSCCWSAEELLAYYAAHGGAGDADPVVEFEGARCGNGFDGEPLVIPTAVVRWTTIGHLRAEVA